MQKKSWGIAVSERHSGALAVETYQNMKIWGEKTENEGIPIPYIARKSKGPTLEAFLLKAVEPKREKKP